LCPYILWPCRTSHFRFSRARRYSNFLNSSRVISSVRTDVKGWRVVPCNGYHYSYCVLCEVRTYVV